MTTDPFSLMRGAFCLQRALANDLAFPESNPGGLPVPQLVTSRQVIEMATIAGAASNRILDKVGTLTPGKEADIIVLEARSHQHLADEQRAGHDCDDDEPEPRAGRAHRREGRVLETSASSAGTSIGCCVRSSRRATGCSLASTDPRKSARFPRASTVSATHTARIFWETAASRGRTPPPRSTCCGRDVASSGVTSPAPCASTPRASAARSRRA